MAARRCAIRIAAARRRASESVPEARADADDPAYWQDLFERNAAAVLAVLPKVHLAAGHAVRYRFYGRRDGDLLVRPFVTRARQRPDRDPQAARLARAARCAARRPASAISQDVELLYRFLSFDDFAAGALQYLLAIQELWASQRWIHSTVLADAEELAQLTAGGDWRARAIRSSASSRRWCAAAPTARTSRCSSTTRSSATR